MEPIKYTITLDDCHDFAVYQTKIPRIKKYIIKQAMPVIIVLSAVLLFIIGFGLFDFFRTLADVHMKYSMSYQDIFTSSSFLPFVIDSIKMFFLVNSLFLLFIFIFSILLIGSVKFDWYKSKSKRVYNLLKGSDLDIEIFLNDNGVECRGKNSSACYNWASIVDIHDTGKSFLMFVADYMAVIIPRRAFADENSAMFFFNSVNEHLNREQA